MSDLRDDFDQLINGLAKLGALAQIKHDLHEASLIDKRECGNCVFWMQSRNCPREHNISGYSRGPSCSGLACEKFEIQPWVTKLKADRIAEIKSRHEKLVLP